jgi:CHASE2 domain-containing sensor protein
MKIGWDLAVGAAILVGALALPAVDSLPLQQLGNLTFDSYQRLKPRDYDPTIKRIAYFRVDPPPANWDGVYEAKTKAG